MTFEGAVDGHTVPNCIAQRKCKSSSLKLKQIMECVDTAPERVWETTEHVNI